MQTTPKDFGYSKAEVPSELAAEAVRAYLQNPNYIKTVAPDVAKRIRGYVNAHPELSKIIQFNALAGVAAIPLLEAASDGRKDPM